MVRFAYTILYVDDVLKATRFYELAFGFTRKFISPGNDYAELVTGDTCLAFASKALAKSNLKDGFLESSISNRPFGIEIGFTTEYVHATLKDAVDAGALLVEEPTNKPWGQVVAYVRDLDGFLVEICTPMGE